MPEATHHRRPTRRSTLAVALLLFAGAVLVALLAIALDILLGVLGWAAARAARPSRGRRPEPVGSIS